MEIWRGALLFAGLLAISRVPRGSATLEEYSIASQRLPDDLNFMPTLGNGHLGYTVYGDAIFMNGIYNGEGGNSRRARIPNWLNFSLSVETVEEHDSHDGYDVDTTSASGSKQLRLGARHYEMNLLDGYFRSIQLLTATSSNILEIEQRTYAHRFYNRALVYELLVRRIRGKAPLSIKLTSQAGTASDAFNFTILDSSTANEDAAAGAGGLKVLKGVTQLIEQRVFQLRRKTIYIALSNGFPIDANADAALWLNMSAGQAELYYRYVLTADESEAVARQEMQKVLSLGATELLARHSSEWQNFWQGFNITVADNLKLSRVINAGIFYLANSLPSAQTNQPKEGFYGLSPTGVGRGNLEADYLGHSFWDTEIWMFPAATQFSVDYGKDLLKYRFEHLAGAQYNARVTGYKGARFPWESAYTGTEATNPCCPDVPKYQIHISADIVFAVKQLYAITNDHHLLCSYGWPITREVAKFIASRVTWHEASSSYHVNHVMPPDEDHFNVNNSIYTNVIFKTALEFAAFSKQVCNISDSANASEWLDIADKLHLIYDAVNDYHPEFDTYQIGTEVKQADVILLGYPLLYAMKNTTRANDLDFYANYTRASGPAMTWSMFAVNYLDIHDTEKAHHYFTLGYEEYVRDEFKVWSEVKRDYHGSANFLTGIGGFLQAIVNGYAGVRFYHEGQQSVMKFQNTKAALPNTTSFTVNGIKFADSVFSLQVSGNGDAQLVCLEKGEKDLYEIDGIRRRKVSKGFTLNIANTKTAYIRTK